MLPVAILLTLALVIAPIVALHANLARACGPWRTPEALPGQLHADDLLT